MYFARLQKYPRSMRARGGIALLHEDTCPSLGRTSSNTGAVLPMVRGPFGDLDEAARGATAEGYRPLMCRKCERRLADAESAPAANRAV